jgi:hypothetical protein
MRKQVFQKNQFNQIISFFGFCTTIGHKTVRFLKKRPDSKKVRGTLIVKWLFFGALKQVCDKQKNMIR